jgi:hypothetical protein
VRALAVVLLIVACDIPNKNDVNNAANGAVDSCREILAEQVPVIVGQITAAALAACSNLSGDVAADVMASLGCAPGDAVGVWDCRASRLLCGGER